MIDRYDDMRADFVSRMVADKCITTGPVTAAFLDTPRHHFLPAFFVDTPTGNWQAINSQHPDYARLVYSNTTLTTQLDATIDPDPSAGAQCQATARPVPRNRR